ncbi:glycoside hydrolase family 3 C-terminal domain-containing protein [Pontibacter sp. G13]|uniref:glycoside hydrolase family 3 C-terminal domain-containing protein n=1 Tax=Pontibacter sp. G13 TaxID=3074898 RepID=UPI00288A6E3C|nr:glycoside hydrolase family 3 N-terminal domain-containing protein [Pontibacter sp. G13]WNJ19690.1 glycoside hydrolase family 3 C-terminal domain-containing protein [Pontibacter sp. G13]
MKHLLLTPLMVCWIGMQVWGQTSVYPFLDPSLTLDERVQDLTDRLTLEEKANQLRYDAPSIDRLGIPSYNWWNEALHGIARNGRATVFPQAIGMAATFDDQLVGRVATAISDEARAKYNAAISIGNRNQYAGLTFWSPNVNLFRDPRWGRGHETYGEDPFLSGTLGAAFVEGLQGDHPTYLKTAACAKHFVVHSGPEAERHTFNAIPPKKDFAETYLPAFRKLVQDAEVEAVMCAYNRTFDEPCCGNSYLLQDVLREQWGFEGHIVSDCWAIVDFFENHKTSVDGPTAAADAIHAGVNVNCGSVFNDHLLEAVKLGLVTEAEIDEAFKVLMKTRFKLGLFDPAGSNPYDAISTEVIHSEEHRALALEAAQKSIVMLKNNGALPLSPNIPTLSVVGPYANSSDVIIGNYYGSSPEITTVVEGIAANVHPGTSLQYQFGQLPFQENVNPIDWTTDNAMAQDAVVAVLGISNQIEGEEGESLYSPTKGDRPQIELPKPQVEFLKKLRSKGDKPLILVLTGGSPVILNDELMELADAVLWIWYPGEAGGSAVADVIFGEVSPSGRLPLTFPASQDQLPDYADYSMKGRTYRFMEDSPAFPFGFGMSYTQFQYHEMSLSQSELGPEGTLEVSVSVENIGEIAGEEVVQLYASAPDSKLDAPLYDLRGFKRVRLAPGETRTVKFTVSASDFMRYDTEGQPVWEEGEIVLRAAGAVPHPRSTELGAPQPVASSFQLKARVE